jgi:hypothetical protein
MRLENAAYNIEQSSPYWGERAREIKGKEYVPGRGEMRIAHKHLCRMFLTFACHTTRRHDILTSYSNIFATVLFQPFAECTNIRMHQALSLNLHASTLHEIMCYMLYIL